MTTYTITEQQRKQLLDFCTFLWRDVPLNDYTQEQLDLVLAEVESLQPNTQEPCAWMNTAGKSTLLTTREPHEDYGTVVENWFPLYTHPAPQQPAEVVELQAKVSAAEARERQTRATLHKFMANQQQPLTVQEVEQILAQHNYELHGDRARYIVRMTEQAHGVKL